MACRVKYEAPLSERYGYLTCFLNELYKRTTCSSFTRDERDDIASSVHNIIIAIKDKMSQISQLFKDIQVKAVGSSMDGTKLNDPDEFDFLFDITFLSNMEEIIIEKVCQENPGTCHVLILSSLVKKEVISQVVDIPEQGNELYLGSLSSYLLRIMFLGCFHEAAREICKANYTMIAKSGKVEFLNQSSSFIDLNSDGPNIVICFKWVSKTGRELGISVDVTPTITLKNHSLEKINKQYLGVDLKLLLMIIEKLKPNHCGFDVRLTPVVSRNCKSGIIPNYERKLCWRMSFSHVEVELVSRMHVTHKKCLIILKKLKSKDAQKEIHALGLQHIVSENLTPERISLIHDLEEMSVLSTYMIKMAVLWHEFQCTCETKTIGDCMIAILNLMDHFVFQRYLPNLFIPLKNCWSTLTKRTPKDCTPLLKIGLDKVRQAFQEIADKENSCFKENLKIYDNAKQFFNDHDGV